MHKNSLILIACLFAAPASAEVFVTLGATAVDITSRFAGAPQTVDSSESGLHLGVGFRRELAQGSIGARIEYDDLGSSDLLGIRAFDYRRYLGAERFAFNAYIGAARLDRATPAFGFYGGVGAQFRDIFSRWDLNIDLRLAKRVARDNLLPTDPEGPSPDNFHDVEGISIYLSRGF